MDFYSEEYGKYIDLVGYLYPDLDLKFTEEEAIEVDFKVIDEENNEGGLLNE